MGQRGKKVSILDEVPKGSFCGEVSMGRDMNDERQRRSQAERTARVRVLMQEAAQSARSWE